MNKGVLLVLVLLCQIGCGGDADGLGIASQCSQDSDCAEDLSCVLAFKNGYCGKSGCTTNADCPETGICVQHEGANYCFRACQEKTECNANRSEDSFANCSANIERTDTGDARVCLPPSAGGG